MGEPKQKAKEAARRLLRASVLTQARDTRDTGFIEYLNDFWQADGAYCRQAASVKGKALSTAYIRHNTGDIRLHIATCKSFVKTRLADVTAVDLERWQLWAREQHGITGNRINHCLKLVKAAIGQAVRRNLIQHNPSKIIAKASETKPRKAY